MADKKASTNMSSMEEPPEAVQHFLTLEDGRKMAYYTFLAEEGSEDPSKKHPVLYLHGFPGTGLEGAVCVREVALAGGCLFSPDRPGFGHSDRWPKLEQTGTGTSDSTLAEGHARTNLFIEDLWSLIRSKGWQSFSVIGVSGGGPYATAMLSSYLEARYGESKLPPIARLEAISLVGGICCAAGIEGMMSDNKRLYDLVAKQKKRELRLTFGMARFFMTILPARLMLKLIPKKELPKVDQACFADPTIGTHMIKLLKSSLRQGGKAAALEVAILFHSEQGFESTLKERYQKIVAEGETDSLPRVAIFQGALDVNVPLSHAEYMHKEWLLETAKVVRYEDLGHISMILQKPTEYSQFAVHGSLSKAEMQVNHNV
jgi:pimeloyl-ACP methyl ester carboxylesterase